MSRTMLSLALLASLLTSARCWSQQIPGVAPPVAAPAAAPQQNLLGFLLPNDAQKANCKNCICNSMLGQMCAAAGGPVSLMSGGLIQNKCALNAQNNAISGAGGAGGGGGPGGACSVAALVQKDMEDAKIRRLCVRYLGTVDCHYWPEAIEALRKSLRVDRNECVRFEAALALQSGCCCDPKIIKALTICVSGSDADGFPSEKSDRVRWAAATALSQCVIVAPVETLPVPPEQLKKVQRPVDPNEFYKKVAQMPREELIANAKDALTQIQEPAKRQTVAPLANPQRSSSLANIFSNAVARGSVAPSPTPAATTAAEPVAAGSNPAPGTVVFTPVPPRQPFFSGLTRTLPGRQDMSRPEVFGNVQDYQPAVSIPSPPTPVTIGEPR